MTENQIEVAVKNIISRYTLIPTKKMVNDIYLYGEEAPGFRSKKFEPGRSLNLNLKGMLSILDVIKVELNINPNRSIDTKFKKSTRLHHILDEIKTIVLTENEDTKKDTRLTDDGFYLFRLIQDKIVYYINLDKIPNLTKFKSCASLFSYEDVHSNFIFDKEGYLIGFKRRNDMTSLIKQKVLQNSKFAIIKFKETSISAYKNSDEDRLEQILNSLSDTDAEFIQKRLK